MDGTGVPVVKKETEGRRGKIDGQPAYARSQIGMLLDTGNATSIVRPGVAHRLNLKVAYAVEQATAARARRAPVAILEEVRAGAIVDRSVEAIHRRGLRGWSGRRSGSQLARSA